MFRKILLAVLILALGLAASPATMASAQGLYDEVNPPADSRLSDDRIEAIWARQQAIYARQGWLLGYADVLITRVEGLITLAGEKGLDISALRAALDAFKIAVKDAHPVHQRAQGIVNSHKGFDKNGQLTDRPQALQTIREMRQAIANFRTAMGGTGRALHEALRTFREAHPPEHPIP